MNIEELAIRCATATTGDETAFAFALTRDWVRQTQCNHETFSTMKQPTGPIRPNYYGNLPDSSVAQSTASAE